MSDTYYAKGMEIWKSPISTDNGDGTTTISIGFQCATATEIVGEEGAQAIAGLLTLADEGGKLANEATTRIAALEAENADLRSGSYLASVVEERDAALAALKEAHATLKTASRQLTEDHKMVLMGRVWGWRTLATIEGVIAKSEAKP